MTTPTGTDQGGAVDHAGRAGTTGITPRAGDAFPDLELPDHTGYTRRLSDVLAGDPGLLHFYRGWWCPKEQAFLRRLVRLQDEMEVAYGRIVSVSVDAPEVQAAFRAGLGSRWTFLSDDGRRHLDALGLRETTDTLHHPYLPAAFLLGPDLRIETAFNGYWYWGRPTDEEVRQGMRAMSRRIRPDWDPPPA
jgi:peroxiredoxin